jgi:hypothetical protein
MKKAMIVLAIGMALFAAAKTVSRGQQTSKDDGAQSSGDVKLLASLPKEHFSVNEEIKLKLVIVNNSADERHLISIGAGRDFKLEISDGQGVAAPLTTKEEVYRRHEGFSVSSGRIILKPDEEREEYVVINEQFNLWIPGTYSITAKRAGPVLEGKSGIIQSNKVSFTID